MTNELEGILDEQLNNSYTSTSAQDRNWLPSENGTTAYQVYDWLGRGGVVVGGVGYSVANSTIIIKCVR